jgi:hypothetical protein
MDEELARQVVELAARAPSVHNTQPWRWQARDGVLNLYADRTRQLTAVDPAGRQLVLSCGAALALARLGIRGLGRSCAVELLPDPADTDHLARLTAGPPLPPTEDELTLARQIGRRRTVRDRVDPVPLTPAARAALDRAAGATPDRAAGATPDRAAGADGAWLHWLDGSAQRLALAVLTDRAERIEQADPVLRAELARWRRSDGDATDGSTSGLPPERPDLVVLATRYDGPTSWLEAGQALARMLLRATELDIATSPLTQALDLPWTRRRLRLELELTGHPQMVLRLGPGRLGREQSPRRPVGEILRV